MSDTGKRNLPSWMSSRDTDRKNPNNNGDEGEKTETAHSKGKGKAGSMRDTLGFSKLLEGVVFVLSGFVNPERGRLRSQAQEMGGEYQPDWNANCTLLISAFPNTPKFRQVELHCGTIVSKEWISECYSQKKLVPIETYLMHAGKPWRKGSISHEASHINEKTTSREKTHKQVERSPPSKSSTISGSSKGRHTKERFSHSEVKKWAIDDLNETVSWLESQEERPEASEVRKIAAEGILTCLQDAIESLEKKRDIEQATKEWMFIPRVVKEIAKLEDPNSSKTYEQALTCKEIYEKEYDNNEVAGDDSDDTIEMTEDEIDHAYNSISSKLEN
ncbi:hypothetical protein ACHQM5_002365 [Ranunculus cassubicifolius]